MTDGEPEACRCAVVEDIHRKPVEADDLSEAVDHAGNVVECVAEFFSRRHVGLTEAGQVRRDYKKSVGEQRDQMTKHVACAREAVQQKQFWRVGWSRFAIENLEAINIGRAISDRRHETLLGLQLSCARSQQALSTATVPSPRPCAILRNLEALAAPNSIIAIHDVVP